MPKRLLALLIAAPVFVSPLAHAQASAPYDFSYRVTGDRRVAPVQVFNDGRNTYVQFKGGQTVPAIFVVDGNGERLTGYSTSEPYVVIPGVSHELILRIGSVTAAVAYEGAARRAATMPAALEPGERSSGASSDTISMRPAYAASGGALVFDAAPADQNLRKTLVRWARMAGWSFAPEHWAVDVDIPLSGAASFGSDFKASVRTLLASTELSSRPLQPCFYSNQVLRVIPLAEACDRTAAVAGAR